ncbi:hypothetical protein BKA70DRAFT_1450975 [Coprinopsis sp. MPI-PUGE-AT-0042]|nr:hypothetical protein BKA70DRAFT_1450975 [Coprinopsis sp. MPI-PUGE-AT-0042]
MPPITLRIAKPEASGQYRAHNPSNLLPMFLQRIEKSRDMSPRSLRYRQVLHFDASYNDVLPWFWPVYDKDDEVVIANPQLLNARVTPDDFEKYRMCHFFLAPCCLCAYIDGVDYTESRIALSEGPPPIRKIDYELPGSVRLVCLEDFYPLAGLRLRKYERRGRPLNLSVHDSGKGGISLESQDERNPSISLVLTTHAVGRKRKTIGVDPRHGSVAACMKRLRIQAITVPSAEIIELTQEEEEEKEE